MSSLILACASLYNAHASSALIHGNANTQKRLLNIYLVINTQIKTWCDLSKLRTRLFSSLCNQSTVNKEVHIYYKGYKLNKDNNIAGNSDPLKKWL